MIDEDLKTYDGVDFSGLFDIDSTPSNTIIEQWERTLMGLCSSPFTYTHNFGLSEDFISGDHLYPANTLGWDKVVLNLLVDRGYNPTKPWFYRFNSVTGYMASFFTTYIDDIITGYYRKKFGRDTSLQLAAGVNYLVQQDEYHK